MSSPDQFLTKSDSSGSTGSLKPSLSIQTDLSREQDNLHAHNSYIYIQIVRERGRQVNQKIWRVVQAHDVIRIFYSHGFGTIR